MRLDKFLSNTLDYSRTEIKKPIKYGKVVINGKTIRDVAYDVQQEDEVIFKKQKISYKKYRYFVMNKPSGVITATKDKVDKTVVDLLNDRHKKLELFPVGRLDKDTEGLLILTNDGEFAHNSLSPKKHVVKTYYVEVDGQVTDDDVKVFFEGVTIDRDVLLKSAILEIISSHNDKSECYVSITEGKFHQIKKMFLTIDVNVTYLKRISFGNFTLPEDLEKGQYRELEIDEIQVLLGEIDE